MAKLPLVEYAVDSIEDAVAAEFEGARRLELCARLDRGGLTPPLELVREARRRLSIPFLTMLRPHDAGHVYGLNELAQLERDGRAALDAGSDGIVVGPLNEDRSIDRSALEAFVNLAEEREITFHRAFDETPHPYHALETLVDCGVTRVLTSGRAPTALEGARPIRELVSRAGGRIIVVACGRIRETNMAEVVRLTGVTEVHRRFLPPSDESR